MNIAGSPAPDLYAALKARDSRFDGRIFVGVATTGIYCRPVCPAKTPKAANCSFYSSAAAAEQAGYRPCMTCRPELAPGQSRVEALDRLAARAARRIEEGALSEMSVEDLGAELGVTGRHLRRALMRSLGVSPIDMAQTQRLLAAKQMLTETRLPATEIAYAAGYKSLRRFNAAFAARYRLAPTRLRKTGLMEAGEDLALTAAFRPPFDFRALAAFLGSRGAAPVEQADGESYVRTLAIGRHQGWLRVSLAGHGQPNRLRVQMSAGLGPVAPQVLARIKRLFDLAAEPAAIAAVLCQDPVLEPVIKRHPGLRLPGAVDGFEILARAILGQQVSVKAATTLGTRLASNFGRVIDTPVPGLTRLTPLAEDLAQAGIARIKAIGLPQRRAETLHRAAVAAAAGSLPLGPGADPEQVLNGLAAVPGLGPWTAAYVAMRVQAWPDAFPASDLGVMKALGVTTPAAAERRANAWRPWRAYGAVYLWKSLEETGP